MIDLNNLDAIKQLDKSNLLGSIQQLPDQIEDAWKQTSAQDYRAYGQDVDHIIVAGMGGSALGAEVTKSLAKFSLKVPLEIVNDYTLPGYVNSHTLVILSSYSGTTEETLAAAKEAQAKQVKIAIVTAGGDLAKLAAEIHCPCYIINPQFNPSNQPRMAIGYSITGLVGLLHSLGLVDLDPSVITNTISFLRSNDPTELAKKLALSVTDKIIYLVSAEHLTGATHVVNNQLNENAKQLTVELKLPELNHHYMEALPHPESAKQAVMFWFIKSNLYSPKLQLRVDLTQDVVTQNNYPSEIISISANNPFTQVFELIQLGAYTNFYLAMLHDIDPAPIPWVDYFKEKLKLHA